MLRLAPVFLLLLAAGCTVERIHQDTHAGLDYLRLSNATKVTSHSRWQFASDTRIAVREISPAERKDWRAAAEQGISRVFGLSAPGQESAAPEADLDLFIAWPGDHLKSTDRAGYIKYLRLDKLLLEADPLSVKVFLCDARTQTLIQASTLDLNPRWFSREGRQDKHIREAFEEFAQGLVTRY